MFDASGPRKVIDYSKPEGYDDAYDVADTDDAAVSGQYRMKHQGEKFSIGGVGTRTHNTQEECKESEPAAQADPAVLAA